jgi:IS30 family transposase
MSHHHLTREQRSELGALKAAGLKQCEIATQLGVHPSTISRELRRCQTRNKSGYHAATAALLARQRRARANGLRRKLICDPKLRRYVAAKLRLDWSPEQICGRLARQGKARLCHETIYAWIYRDEPHLKGHLRHGGTHYRRRRGTNKRWYEREKRRRRWIDDRPGIVAARLRLGDWEGDTVVGTDQKSRLLTYTERKSGYELAATLSRATFPELSDKTVQLFANLPTKKKQTLTLDNGREFNQFEYIEATTGLIIYFCHPYRSWERGTNENTNGLLRQYFPKKTSLEFVTQAELDRAVARLNTRPRKRLGYRTPAEVFRENCVSD